VGVGNRRGGLMAGSAVSHAVQRVDWSDSG
jgi:hypothetical protein